MENDIKIDSSNKNNKKKNIIIGIIALLVMIVLGGYIYIESINSMVNEWSNKIYPGVIVEGVNLSGKSKEEAKDILEKDFKDKINDKNIVIMVNDKNSEYKAKYSKIEPKYDIDKAINEAFNYGKESNIFEKSSLIKNRSNKNYEIQLNFTYNDKKLQGVEDEVIKKFEVKPKNASLYINGKDISVTDDISGFLIDKKELDKELKEKINGNPSEDTKVNISYKEEKAKVTKKDLDKINGIIGSFSSSYQTSDNNRATNISVVTGFVNGTLLMPGEVFSYSETSQRDKSLYKEGNVYINDRIEKDIGGGICQVSTALYRATMEANIRPTERHNHSMTVGYSSPGLDATVAWGYLDFKFKNPYDFPIYIQGITHNKTVTFNIYGDVNGLGGRTYDMENEIVKVIPPTEEVTNDPSLPEGQRVVVSNGTTGYIAKGYQLTYENGKLINRELVSTDMYKMVPTKVKVGIKK